MPRRTDDAESRHYDSPADMPPAEQLQRKLDHARHLANAHRTDEAIAAIVDVLEHLHGVAPAPVEPE